MSIVLVGSTSGSVTLQEPAVAGTTVLTLPAVSGTVITTGTTGQVIASGALPIGSVLQVVNLETVGYTINNTNTYADVPNVSLAITPKFATSKILVMINLAGVGKAVGNTFVRLRLLKNGSELVVFNDVAGWTNSTTESLGNVGYNYLDSPATTSATTYKVQFCSGNNTAQSYVGNYIASSTSTRHSITLIEVAA